MIIDINEKLKIVKKCSNFSKEIETKIFEKYNQSLSLILKHENDGSYYKEYYINYFNNFNTLKSYFFFFDKNTIIIEELRLSAYNYWAFNCS